MKSLIFAFLTILNISAFAANTNNACEWNNQQMDIFHKKATLKAGTLVMLESTETINSHTMTIGQLVQFKVKTNVYAEGKLVIRTGALALGRVKSVQKATYNHPAQMTIELTSVQAIDGQSIALNGTEQTLKGAYRNQGMSIHQGTMVSANVMNDQCVGLN